MRARLRVGGGPCYGGSQPQEVWFFDRADARGQDEPLDDTNFAMLSVVRAVFASP